MQGTPRTQRIQRTQRILLAWWALTFVSLVPFVSSVFHAAAPRVGTIRGRVDLRRVAPPIERRPGVAELGTPPPQELTERLRSVVYLESAPRGACETNAGGAATMNQPNQPFS